MAKNDKVLVQERTKNPKLRGCHVTQKPQIATCPKGCPFLGNGCHIEGYPQKFTTDRLNVNGSDISAIQACKIEADSVAKLSGKFPLRIANVGDSPTRESVKVTAKAMIEYESRTGQPAWTYTHGWSKRYNLEKDIPAKFWTFKGKTANVLASCHNISDVIEAKKLGYRSCSIVVKDFPNGPKAYNQAGEKMIPCPNESVSKNITCKDCRLCMDVGKLNGANIAFKAHGANKKLTYRSIL